MGYLVVSPSDSFCDRLHYAVTLMKKCLRIVYTLGGIHLVVTQNISHFWPLLPLLHLISLFAQSLNGCSLTKMANAHVDLQVAAQKYVNPEMYF